MNNLYLALALMPISGACLSMEESTGTLVHEDGPRQGWVNPLQQSARAAALVGTDQDGLIAVIRLDDAEVIARLELGDRPPGLVDVSAALDEAGALSHLALLAQDEEEQFGALTFGRVSDASFSLTGGAQYQGQTRVFALADGALVMQQEIGQRWSFTRIGDSNYTSTSCPAPASILGVRGKGADVEIQAFGWDADERPLLIHGALKKSRFHCQLSLIEHSPPLSRTARAAMVKGIGTIIVDATSGGVSVGLLSDLNIGSLSTTRQQAGRIEHAEPWSLADSAGVAVLTSDPAQLLVLSLRRGSEGRLEIEEYASALLAPVGETTWFSRELALAGDRIFVATESGLAGFELTLGPTLALGRLDLPPALASLRGPLAALPKLPF